MIPGKSCNDLSTPICGFFQSDTAQYGMAVFYYRDFFYEFTRDGLLLCFLLTL